MKDAIIFIESNTTTGELFFLAAKKSNLEPILITTDPSKYSFLQNSDVRVFGHETSNEINLIDFIRNLKSNYIIKGICSSSEYFIETASNIAKQVELPAADSTAIKICRDKVKQHQILNSAGVAVPKFNFIYNKEGWYNISNTIGFPIIVKPAMGSGSVGVKLCKNLTEATDHVEKLLSNHTNERGLQIEPKVLLEEYIDGQEYSVECFGEKIIGITKKHVSKPPYFIETGHDFPYNFKTPSIMKQISETTLKAINALGLSWGPTHIELKAFDNKIIIIEVNPRMAGGYIPELVHVAFNIDLIQQYINLVTNNKVILTSKFNSYASIRFLIPKKSGVLHGVEMPKNIKEIKEIHEIKLYKKLNEQIKLFGDFRDRIGHVIFKSKNPKVELLSNDVISKFKINMNNDNY